MTVEKEGAFLSTGSDGLASGGGQEWLFEPRSSLG